MENKIDSKKSITKEIIEKGDSKNTIDKEKIFLQSSRINLNSSEKKNNIKESQKIQIQNSKNHNSTSFEDNEKILYSPTKYRIQKLREKIQNTENHSNTNKNKMKTTQSNYLLSTNDTLSNEKHKKIKFIKKFNFDLSINKSDNKKKNINNRINIENYENLFKNINYKKTIIIDKDGNNNLNLNDSSQSYNSDKNSLFINSTTKNSQEDNKILYKSDLASKEDFMKRTTSIDIMEEKNRLNEYNRIFNLLNSNIEQFKNIFMKNTQFSNNKNINGRNNGKNNKIKKQLGTLNTNLSEKKLKQKLNISKSEKILLNIIQNNGHNNFESKNNLDTNPIKGNKNSDLNNNYSFLESCLQDEFYQSMLNNTILEEDKGRNGKNENIEKEIWDKYDIYEHTQNEIFDDKKQQNCIVSPRKLINNNENTQKKNEKLSYYSDASDVDCNNNCNNIDKNNIDDNNNKCSIF